MTVRQYVTFYLADTLWGVDILQVREILRRVEVATVPQAPSHVFGLMNLRGQIVTLLDLGSRLGHPPTTPDMCIVLRTDAELAAVAASLEQLEPTGEDSVGVLVDRLGDVVEVADEDLDRSPANASVQERAFVKAVAPLDPDLMLVLRLGPALAD